MSEHLFVVGPGRVGGSLALDLAHAGRFESVTVVGRGEAPPDPIARSDRIRYVAAGADGAVAEPLGETRPPEALVFCVPDDRLREVVAAWAAGVPPQGAKLRYAVHTSGLHDAEALAPLRRHGAAVASWHPLLAIGTPRRGRFRACTFGVEGDPAAVEWASGLALELGATAVRVRSEAKALYHAAAVYGSNFLIACLAVAARLLAESLERSPVGAPEGRFAGGPGGLPATGTERRNAAGPDESLTHLVPLARSALDSLAASGLARGATGPVTRGDVGTIARHLDALDPAARRLYRALAAELLRLDQAGLPEETRGRLAALLESEEGGEEVPTEGGGPNGL